jgi:hypothetical protein
MRAPVGYAVRGGSRQACLLPVTQILQELTCYLPGTRVGYRDRGRGAEPVERCARVASVVRWGAAVLGAMGTLDLVITVAAVAAEATQKKAPTVSASPFGRTADGTSVELYTLRNGRGMEARIATYGAILVSLTAPDRHGRFGDVVLGYDSLEGYLKSSPYFGALIGRYGTSKSLGSRRDMQVTR